MTNLAVFFGGKSTEHDVSIVTAMQMINFLDKSKYNIFAVYVDKNNKLFVLKDLKQMNLSLFKQQPNKKNFYEGLMQFGDNCLYKKHKNKIHALTNIDVGLMCFHGGMGEDGSFSGFASCSNFPITCSSFVAMGLAMQKDKTKQVCQESEISISNYEIITKQDWTNNCEEFYESVLAKLGTNIVVKPNSQGSSIGVSVAKTKQEFFDAVELAFEFDNKVVCETQIQNLREFNCSAMQDQDGNILISEVEEPTIKDEILSFKSKYLSGGKSVKGGEKMRGMASLSRRFPANISKKLKEKIQQQTKLIYSKLGLCGVVRVDFLFDKTEELLFLNEVNTIPGSLAYYFWKPYFKTESLFLDNLIQSAIRLFEKNKPRTTVFDSCILG